MRPYRVFMWVLCFLSLTSLAVGGVVDDAQETLKAAGVTQSSGQGSADSFLPSTTSLTTTTSGNHSGVTSPQTAKSSATAAKGNSPIKPKPRSAGPATPVANEAIVGERAVEQKRADHWSLATLFVVLILVAVAAVLGRQLVSDE